MVCSNFHGADWVRAHGRGYTIHENSISLVPLLWSRFKVNGYNFWHILRPKDAKDEAITISSKKGHVTEKTVKPWEPLFAAGEIR